MEKLIRSLSNGLCNLGYVGVIAGGAITFVRTTDTKQSVYLKNAALHFAFVMSTFFLSFMKLRAFPYHLSVQLVQDLGCAVGCYPTYAVWAYHDYLNLFNRDK